MKKSRKQREVSRAVNHPYVGLRITPMLGDFVSQSRITVKYLRAQDLITAEEQAELLEALSTIFRTENRKLVNSVVDKLKSV